MQSRELSKQDNELLTRISEVLHYLWDPIGVSDVPAARDEYDSYIGHTFTLLKQNADVENIRKHLEEVRVVNMGMGLRGDSRKENEIAEILIEWRETIYDE